MKSSIDRALKVTAYFLLAFAYQVAYAAAPVGLTAGTANFKNDLVTILTPVLGIAVMAIGIAWWFGKVSWMWLVGAIGGTILFFGHQQIVNWVRGVFSV